MRRPTNDRPVKLMVGSGGDDGQEYVVTIYPQFLTIRPKGARKDDATVETTFAGVYQRALMNRAAAEAPKPRRKRVKRGLLSL